LTETFSGILLAIGCSVPEMTTNTLSCFNKSQEMIDFGFGAIVGSGVFGFRFNNIKDFTLCFGVAALYSFNYH
jgi:hypothetical protein